MKNWRRGRVRVDVLSERGGVSTGVLVRAAKSALLVDCGDGIARDLSDSGLPPEALAGVVVTHDHGDHCAGLLGLFWWLRLRGRAAPLVVLTPRRAEMTGGQIALHRRVYRRRQRFAIRQRVMVVGRPNRLEPFTITSFPVRHRRTMSDPPTRLMEVHGLRMVVDGLHIIFSSDTGPSVRLEKEVDGADLAVVEAGSPARSGRPPADTHLTAAQAHAIGRRAKTHLLYHRG